MDSHTLWMLGQLTADERQKVSKLVERLYTRRVSCAYPGCSYYKKATKTYCTNGCAWDHEDWKRIRTERARA